MKAIVAEGAGFCFGVKRALKLAFEAARQGDGTVVTLGAIIHNPQVVARLEEEGLRVVRNLDQVEGGTLVVRSHGLPRRVLAEAEAKNMTIIDATCPFVKQAQERAAQLEREGHAVVVVGEEDHPEVLSITGSLEGQATVAAEILAQMPEDEAIDMLVLPVGGGGLSAGMTRYLADSAIDFRFVEPAGGPSLKASLQAGKLVTLPKVDSFVDGAAVARIGERNFAALAGVPAAHVLEAPEDRICATMVEMLNIEGVVLEPAGALAIDGLRDIKDIAGKTVVAVVSGGNFDFERLPDVKERALRYAGLKKYFILRMPQRPGALKDFLGILGPDDDIARFEYLKKSARNFGSVLIGIETRDPAGFERITAEMDAHGFAYEDITDNATLANFIV